MSKRWDGPQVHRTTHSSLWADLGMIMKDGLNGLTSNSAQPDFVTSTSNLIVIKPGQIVEMIIQVDSFEMLPNNESDGDKSIPSTQSGFSCVESPNNFWYPSIISDEAMDAEEEEFDLDMDIVEAPLSRPQEILMKKGTMLKYVHDLFVRASKNLSPKKSAKVKELLVEHNDNTFHDPEKPLTRTNIIEHEIPTIGRPVRIPRRRVAPG